MRVLVLHDRRLAEREGITGETAGGLDVHVRSFLGALESAGYTSEVIPLRPEANAPAPSLRGFRHRFRERTVHTLEERVEAFRPDLIHLQGLSFAHPRLVGRLASRRPLVWSLHDTAAVCPTGTDLYRDRDPCQRSGGLACAFTGCWKPRGPRELVRLPFLKQGRTALARAQRVLVPSDYLAGVLTRNGVPPSKIDVLPLFSRFTDTPGHGSAEGETPRLLFVGRVSRQKGFLALVAALEEMPGLPWTLHVAGQGPAARTGRERLERAGLGQRVRWLGELGPAELLREYQGADLVAMPSLAPESFGLVGVEAMALGRPVVAFDSGAITEWLDSGVTGRVVPRADVSALARALGALLTDPVLRAKMGAAARELAQQRYGVGTYLSRLAELYAEVCSGSRSG